MNGPLIQYGVMLFVGMILGALFFGGLWMTVRQMTTSKRPGLLFMTSVIARSVMVLVGIWYFAADDAMAIACCLLGFIGIRLLATHGTAVFGTTFGKRELHQ